jgi:predicted DNA repair protein MutK
MATHGVEVFARAAGSSARDNRRNFRNDNNNAMASSLLALLDDIATLLDDVSILTKVAAKKTAGVLGDDLALNAQQVTGVTADRELPVVWAVAKGSMVNKAILVPLALAISALAPWAVVPLLMIGGAFLCFEGFEKLAHRFLHSRQEDEAHHHELTEALVNPQVDLVAVEKEKIKGAIRTDFILSAEIIAITLGTVADADFVTRVAVLVGIAALMTVGVYGLVAGIVKLDDLGLYLSRRASAAARAIGAGILRAAPWLMKTLSVAGTAAMFLVGGGILVHGIAPLHHAIEALGHGAGGFGWLVTALLDALVGIVAGALVLAAVTLGKRLFARNKPEPA